MAADGDFHTHSDSSCPPSRSRGSQNNTAKILPGLNPNLLKQVESLPLRAHRERTWARYLPPFSHAYPHVCIFPKVNGDFTSTSSGGDWKEKPSFQMLLVPERRLSAVAMVDDWVSETGLHWTERRIHSRCLHSRQWRRRSTSTFSAAPWHRITAPSSGVNWNNPIHSGFFFYFLKMTFFYSCKST